MKMKRSKNAIDVAWWNNPVRVKHLEGSRRWPNKTSPSTSAGRPQRRDERQRFFTLEFDPDDSSPPSWSP